MHNAFLVIRTVFFALFTYFYIVILIFASWNVAAAKSSGMSAPGASVFLLINSIFMFMLVPIAYLAEQICARARPAHVRTECAWTALMSTLQLAASVDVTVGSSIYCHTNPKWAMCASTSLLVQVSWLATFSILSYCLTLCVAAATHAESVPEIWTTPVPHVPWFRPSAEAEEEPAAPVGTPKLPTREKTLSTWSGESCAVTKYIAERWDKLSRTERQSMASGPILFTRGRQSDDATRPAWARLQSTRRGVDHPFAHPLPRCKGPPPQVALPPLPPATHSSTVARPRESCFVEGSERRETSSTRSDRMATNVFPKMIADPDSPIPRPNLSEWVRADTVHKGPGDSIV